MKYFKKMIGERIYLSPANIEDSEQYCEWLNDLSIMSNLGPAHCVISLESEKESLTKMLKTGHLDFAIIDIASDKLLGNVGLLDVDHINRNAMVSLFIGELCNRSRGYGTEALKLILDFGFNILNLHNIMLNVFDFNKIGIACYYKVGFKEIGRRREARVIGRKNYDIVYMYILSTEFESPYVKKIMEIGD